MQTANSKKWTAWATMAVMVFSLFISPANSYAKWKDRSSELPGMTSTENLILIGVGTVAVIGLIYLVSSSNDDQKENSDSPDIQSATSDSSRVSLYQSGSKKFSLDNRDDDLDLALNDTHVLPYVGLKKMGNSNMNTMVVGVAIGF